MVSAGMVLGRSMAAVAGGQVVELWYMVSAVDGECCGDGAAKEHCRGCWRSGGGVAVDGECGDGARKEHCRGCWRSGDGVAVEGECGDGASAGMVQGRSIAAVSGGQVIELR